VQLEERLHVREKEGILGVPAAVGVDWGALPHEPTDFVQVLDCCTRGCHRGCWVRGEHPLGLENEVPGFCLDLGVFDSCTAMKCGFDGGLEDCQRGLLSNGLVGVAIGKIAWSVRRWW